MWSEKFEQLIEGFCGIYNMDAKHVLDGNPVAMDGVMFVLRHDKETDSPQITVYCNFGKAPQELEARIYRRLLETNMSIYTGQGESFGMDTDGNVVFVNSYPLEFTTPEELAAYLSLTTLHAKSWRESYFLNEEDQPRKKTWQGARLMKKGSVEKGED